MKNLTVARRYAKALFELAVESKSLDDILQAMLNIHHALRSERALEKILFSPVITPEAKQDIVRSITSNKLVLKFVFLLARRRRLELIPAIYDHLLHLADEAQGINRILIKTAAALSEVHKKMIERDLAQKFGGKIVGQFEVAKELIGGVWMKIGDQVLDVTLRGHFDDLRHALLHSSN